MAKPTTIDEYLSQLPDDQRRALSNLRKQIKAAAPKAEEYIGYGLAGFKLNGRPLIYMGAAKNHCAIYGARADDALAEKLKSYTQSKGTIQFAPDKPIPAAVVKLIVKARVEALEQRLAAKKKPGTSKKKVGAAATKRAPKRQKKKASAAAAKRAPKRKV